MALTDEEYQNALNLLLHEEPANMRLGYTLLSAYPDRLSHLTLELLVAAQLTPDEHLAIELRRAVADFLPLSAIQQRQAALELYTIHQRYIHEEERLEQIVADHLPYAERLAAILLRNKQWALRYLEIGYWLQHRAKAVLDFVEVCYTHVLKAHPNHRVAYEELASLYIVHHKDYQRAMYCYRAILHHRPDDHHTMNAWALLYLRHIKHYYGRAIELLEQARALSPNTASYHFHLALAYEKAGHTALQEALLEEGVERFSNYSEGLIMAANHWSDVHQDYDRAKSWYEKALQVNPRSVYALGNLAELYAEGLEDYETAAAYYYKTMRRQLHPYFMTNFITLLVLHIKDFDAGKKYYLKRAELDAEQREEAESELSDAQLAAYRKAETVLLDWLSKR